MNEDSDSSITVNQPPPRDGVIRARQLVPFANLRPPPPPLLRRIIYIPHQMDIVTVLSNTSRVNRQAMYIVAGRGYVSLAKLVLLPSRQQTTYIGRGKITYMSGWFQNMFEIGSIVIPTSRTNGILHVAINYGLPHVSVATRLIAFGNVQLDVVFVGGPGAIVGPDAAGGVPMA